MIIIENEKLHQINNGFKENYYISESGKIYNSKTGKFLKPNKYQLPLKRIDNQLQTVSINQIYRMIFNKDLIIDNTEDLPLEEWREIEGTGGKYFVSNFGRVKSYKFIKAAILKENTVRGYKAVRIYFESGNSKQVYIHRLVAAAFLKEEAAELKEIHHIDGNSTNNKASNLRYLTIAEHRAIHNKGATKNE